MSDACPSNDVVAAFLAKDLTPPDERSFEEHLDRCESCRSTVAVLAEAFLSAPQSRAMGAPPPSPAGLPLALVGGTRVGRYVVKRRIGRGGMGVVYAAFDPSLDRDVAVKLLTTDVHDERSRKALLREARVMAQVSHPHVVAVYDVGFFEEFPFVAMELVSGTTLREHLARGASFRETLQLLCEAGEGLAAIHDAGLVHRDFKPENVLIGTDGRVRVSDFGLARLATAGEPAAVSSTSNEVDGSESRWSIAASASTAADGSPAAFGVAGTPGYMAPEQHRANEVDARADQYAFALTLFEALEGARPFSGGNLLAKKLAGPPVPRGKLASASRRVRAAVSRALSPDPDARFGSMRELLDRVRPAARSRAWPIAIVAGAIALAASALLITSARREANACSSPTAYLEVGWDDAQRRGVKATFERSKLSWAGSSSERVISRLDAYASDWASARVDACELGRRTRDPLSERAPLRVACLDDRMRSLRALVTVLEEADDRSLDRAVDATLALDPVSECVDDEALIRRVDPPPLAARSEVDRLREVIARGSALTAAGRFDEAKSTLETAKADVDTASYEPLHAEYAFARAVLSQELVGQKGTEKLLREAISAAEASRSDRVGAEAWLRYARFFAWEGHDYDRADLAITVAEGAITRIGGDPRMRDDLARYRAFLAMAKGKVADAVDGLRELERAQRERLGPDAPVLVPTLEEHWRATQLLGRYDESYEAASDAARIAALIFGPQHPRLGEMLAARGAAELRTGRLAEAKVSLEKSLAILEAAFGKEHTKLDFTLEDLARLASVEGRHDEAVRLAQRAVSIDEHAFAPGAPAVGFALAPLAEVLLRAGRVEDALREAERADAIWRPIMPPDHFILADVDTLLASSGAVAGRKGSLEMATRVHDYFEKHEAPPERRAEAALALGVALSSSEKPDDRARAEKLCHDAVLDFGNLGDRGLLDVARATRTCQNGRDAPR